MLFHDLVPIRRPEWTHAGIVSTFESWYRSVLPFCDLVPGLRALIAALPDRSGWGRVP